MPAIQETRPHESRPLDSLNSLRGKRVTVELKSGTHYTGKLKSFDMHVNLALEEAEDGSRKFDSLFIRGDTITIVYQEKAKQ